LLEVTISKVDVGEILGQESLRQAINYFINHCRQNGQRIWRDYGEVQGLLEREKALIENFIARRANAIFRGWFNDCWSELRKMLSQFGLGMVANSSNPPKTDVVYVKALVIFWLSVRLRYRESSQIREQLGSVKSFVSHFGGHRQASEWRLEAEILQALVDFYPEKTAPKAAKVAAKVVSKPPTRLRRYLAFLRQLLRTKVL